MKVLHVITGLGRGGAEAKLVRLLGASGGSHAVASMTGRGVYADAIGALGVPVHDLGMPRGLPDPRGLLRLRRIAREFAPDVVHGWMYHASLLSLLSASGRPVIVSIRHSIADIAKEKFLTRRVIRALAARSHRAAHILYNSRISRAQHEGIGYCPHRASVIPNGFDTKIFRPDPEARIDVRGELGIAADKVVVLHAARFHPMKDHAGYMAAIMALWSDPRLVFLLAGTGVTPDNPVLAPCLRDAPAGRVRLLGERDDMRGLMAAADIFCLSSRWGEAFPNVLGEAMACGLPCVTTDVGDTAHIVGDAGLVVPLGNADALGAAIRHLVDLRPEQRAEPARRARARIVENFSLDSVMAAYRDLYECTLCEGRYTRRHVI